LGAKLLRISCFAHRWYRRKENLYWSFDL